MAIAHERAEVLGVKPLGSYHLVSMVAPGVAAAARPGQFLTVGVGGDASSMLLRRAFSIYRTRAAGVYGGTVDLVVADVGPGTHWLVGRKVHDVLDVIGPLGRGFSLPRQPAHAVLVGGGYGAAALFGLAEALRARGCRVDFILGSATESGLFGVLEGKRMAASVTVTTDDGSVGEAGRATDVLHDVIERTEADVVYACGPMGMLAAVDRICADYNLPCQLAVEESMACGIGVCMTCVLPVRGDDGMTRMLRSCKDGPVFNGGRVDFAAVGTIPANCVGAPGEAK
jgi:dihydroorotate dehydrogenase electron transfer subunit